MDVNNTVIMVNYRKTPKACECCGRAYDSEDTEVGQYEFTVRGFFEWNDWMDAERFAEQVPLEADKLHEGLLAESVQECLYSTIDFYEGFPRELIEIEPVELAKAFEAVKFEVNRLLTS